MTTTTKERTVTDTNTVPRMTYAERWRAMSKAEKVKLVGDASVIPELDRLAAGKDGADRDEQVEADREALRALAPRLEGIQAHRADLIADRRRLFVRLLLRGEQVSTIAEDAGKTAMVVNVATGISKKNR